jgi:NAD(P)-dependent dehydrogenase (short-subunit alcohol dehydrogenase family)
LHILILNAGILNPTFKLTGDGFEEMFQVNYMSQAYLTFGLIASMLNTKTDSPPRVIAISCESHRVECPGISTTNGIISDRLTPRSPNHFDHLLAYGQSKLCLIMFIAEFRRNYPRWLY